VTPMSGDYWAGDSNVRWLLGRWL